MATAKRLYKYEGGSDGSRTPKPGLLTTRTSSRRRMNPFRPKTVPRVPVTENPDPIVYTERDYNTILHNIEPWRVEVICRYCGEKETDTVNRTADRAIWLMWLHQKFAHNKNEPKPTNQLLKKQIPNDIREAIKAKISDDLETARLS